MTERVALNKRVEGAGQYFALSPDDVEFFSSGSKTLDLALGGGWAEGRVANVIGDKSTGKTLLCIEACNNFALKYPKGRIRYRESEQAFQKGYASALGMPTERVDFGKKPLVTVENLFDELDDLWSKDKAPSLTIVDSLDALSDAAELDREFSEGSFGAQKAKDMSKMFRMLISKIGVHTLIIVSQIRDKINVRFGRQWTRSGGRALDFYASQVVVLAQAGERLKRRHNGIERVTGVLIKAKLDKNKIGQPFREADFDIVFGWGVDDITSCLNFLAQVGSLSELGVSKDKIKSYVRTVTDLPTGDYYQTLHRIHNLVAQRWVEIETSFLPKTKKYRT